MPLLSILPRILIVASLMWLCVPLAAWSQETASAVRPVVVDPQDLPLPGVRIDIRRGEVIVATIVTDADGTFELTPGPPGDVVEASIDGFETARVSRAAARRIRLGLARTAISTDVVASALTSGGAAMEHIGSTMTSTLAQRLPTPRPRILQSLSLLPAVVRGRDGLLRLGGTRPHEASLWVDGFNVTDPVTNTTAIDLPNESVKGMAVVRDPISATFSHAVGSIASMETTVGSGEFRGGVQGFIPRPRLNSQYGLGRIEAFFPRAYVGGHAGRARYFASTEFSFERVPIPGVTNESGSPASGATGLTTFGRVDFQVSPTQTFTVEGLFVPVRTMFSGLSPLVAPEAAPDRSARDAFAGVIDRIVLGPSELLTVRAGVLYHRTEIGSGGTGTSVLRPDGWHDNWFSRVTTSGVRRLASVAWDRSNIPGLSGHSFSVLGEVESRSMSGDVSHVPIRVEDDLGRLTRTVSFGSALDPLSADDLAVGGGIRDLWDVTKRLQVDLNVRFDWDQRSKVGPPSPRLGVRYVIEEAHKTTIKASVGRFVGLAPLSTLTYGQFSPRFDSTYDPVTGRLLQAVPFQPVTRELDLPRSDVAAIDLERELRPGLEAQISLRLRHGSHLPTINVVAGGGPAPLESTGTRLYREMQISARRTWGDRAQLFGSYVWAYSTGDQNDFGSLFMNLDAPFVEPGGTVTTAAHVPHRLRAWATTSLPLRIVVSPAVEWRSGFPYSRFDQYYRLVGTANSEQFPAYFAVDLTVFKTFDAFNRKADLGLQVFNLTNHFNPRDVIPVVSSPRFGELTNNPGVTLGGYMQVRW